MYSKDNESVLDERGNFESSMVLDIGSLRLSSGFVGLMPGSQGSAKRLQRLTRN